MLFPHFDVALGVVDGVNVLFSHFNVALGVVDGVNVLFPHSDVAFGVVDGVSVLFPHFNVALGILDCVNVLWHSPNQEEILNDEVASLVQFMYLVFTRMPGESYRRRFVSLLLRLCDVYRALINSFCLLIIICNCFTCSVLMHECCHAWLIEISAVFG